MKTSQLIIISILLLNFSSCNGKAQKAKEQVIENSISQMSIQKTFTDSTFTQSGEDRNTQGTTDQTLLNIIKAGTDQMSPGDSIIGVWEVRNDYYLAIYEIEKYDDQYFGKIHYYNDGTTEIEAKNNSEDYFMDGVAYQNGEYTTGKIYMPNGTIYETKFMIDHDVLTAQMTIQGQPYKEVWKRKRYK